MYIFKTDKQISHGANELYPNLIKEANMPNINQFEVSDLPENRKIVTTDGVTHIEARKIKFSEII